MRIFHKLLLLLVFANNTFPSMAVLEFLDDKPGIKISDKAELVDYGATLRAFQAFADELNQPNSSEFSQVKNSINEIKLLESVYVLSQRLARDIPKGSGVIFLGRSPLWIKRSFDLFFKEAGKYTSLSVMFSGTPGMAPRPQEIITKKQNDNIITQDQLEFYFEYLDKLDLGTLALNSNASGKKIYIVDHISSGLGLNAFLQILEKYFKARNVDCPDLVFVSFKGLLDSKFQIGAGFEIRIDKTKGKTLVFLPRRHSGYRELSISFMELITVKLDLQSRQNPKERPYIDQTAIVINSRLNDLDRGDFQAVFSEGVYYPAAAWHEGGVDPMGSNPLLVQLFYPFLEQKLEAVKQKLDYCNGCGKKPEKLFHCNSCYQATYCSPECLRSHAQTHYLECQGSEMFKYMLNAAYQEAEREKQEGY